MKKVLVINNKYKIKGGEDSNIIDEIKKSLSSYELVTAIPSLTKHSPSRS